MAVIDTSKIENFDSMSVEQKLEAVLAAEIPDPVDLSKYVSKDVFDKKASEASALSKQLKEKMTDDEIKKAESDKALADMMAELETLRKDKTVSDYTAKYIALGYDKDLAADTAKAMAEGNMAKVFENGEKHRVAIEKKIKEDILNKTPKPDGSGGNDDKGDTAVDKAREIAKAKNGSGKTYEDIMKNYKN